MEISQEQIDKLKCSMISLIEAFTEFDRALTEAGISFAELKAQMDSTPACKRCYHEAHEHTSGRNSNRAIFSCDHEGCHCPDYLDELPDPYPNRRN
jgi:hypothetical protein